MVAQFKGRLRFIQQSFADAATHGADLRFLFSKIGLNRRVRDESFPLLTEDPSSELLSQYRAALRENPTAIVQEFDWAVELLVMAEMFPRMKLVKRPGIMWTISDDGDVIYFMRDFWKGKADRVKDDYRLFCELSLSLAKWYFDFKGRPDDERRIIGPRYLHEIATADIIRSFGMQCDDSIAKAITIEPRVGLISEDEYEPNSKWITFAGYSVMPKSPPRTIWGRALARAKAQDVDPISWQELVTALNKLPYEMWSFHGNMFRQAAYALDRMCDLNFDLEQFFGSNELLKSAGFTNSQSKNSPQINETQMHVFKKIVTAKILLLGPDALAGIPEQSGKKALAKLEKLGLIHRPNGPKSGYGPTSEGTTWWSQINTK